MGAPLASRTQLSSHLFALILVTGGPSHFEYVPVFPSRPPHPPVCIEEMSKLEEVDVDSLPPELAFHCAGATRVNVGCGVLVDAQPQGVPHRAEVFVVQVESLPVFRGSRRSQIHVVDMTMAFAKETKQLLAAFTDPAELQVHKCGGDAKSEFHTRGHEIWKESRVHQGLLQSTVSDILALIGGAAAVDSFRGRQLVLRPREACVSLVMWPRAERPPLPDAASPLFETREGLAHLNPERLFNQWFYQWLWICQVAENPDSTVAVSYHGGQICDQDHGVGIEYFRGP